MVTVAWSPPASTGGIDLRNYIVTPYLDGVEGPFDLITANLPYVREIDRAGLSPTVLREPHVALLAGLSASALATIDVACMTNRRISRVYLLDAVPEVLLAAWWSRVAPGRKFARPSSVHVAPSPVPDHCDPD